MRDTFKAPMASLAYGFLMSFLIIGVSVLAWRLGSMWLMMFLLCGFVFIAPISCIGIYAISAQLERNQPVSFIRSLRACLKRYIGTELVFALVLLVIFLVWARASSAVSIFLPASPEAEMSAMSGYILVVCLVALLFLSITFMISAFSLPMIMHREVDAITAIVTSLNAVMRNKLVLVLWGIMIAFLILIGLLSAGLLLVVFLPVIGHAVWHSYLETIDASEFPRHKIGITSTPVKQAKTNS